MRWFRRPRPWLLIGSLAANLFFAGLVVAAVAFEPFDRPSAPPPIRYMMKVAGPEARPVFEAAMAAHADEMKAAGEAYRAAREDARQAMTAATVDPAALRQAFAAQSAARSRLAALMEDVFVEAVPALDLETREALAEPRWKRRKRDDDD